MGPVCRSVPCRCTDGSHRRAPQENPEVKIENVELIRKKRAHLEKFYFENHN